MTGDQRFRRCKTATTALVQHRLKRSKSQADGVIVDHKLNLAATIRQGNPQSQESYVQIQLFINSPLASGLTG
jgi:hypothetical protein